MFFVIIFHVFAVNSLFDAQRNKLTHGYWDETQWTYRGPSCGSGEGIFNPNTEDNYLDTCFGASTMPRQFLVYDFGTDVILNKYSWSRSKNKQECPSSWEVYGAKIYPAFGTDMFLLGTESNHLCTETIEMIDFEVNNTEGTGYRYYAWKLSKSDNANGNNDGYQWGTIQFFTGPGEVSLMFSFGGFKIIKKRENIKAIQSLHFIHINNRKDVQKRRMPSRWRF